GVTFAVEQGEIFGLLGPNGAGKSTLIRMLTTLLPPTAGTARVSGFDIVTQADAVRHVIGVIPPAMTSDLEPTIRHNFLIHPTPSSTAADAKHAGVSSASSWRQSS